MSEELLQKLLSVIEDPQYVVMWNNGKDEYRILQDNTYKYDEELKVFFKDFRGDWIDLYSATLIDFKIFKEIEL